MHVRAGSGSEDNGHRDGTGAAGGRPEGTGEGSGGTPPDAVPGESPRQGTETAAGNTGPAPVRRSRLGRFLRNRTVRTVTVAGLVGALLGAGVVAWRTDTLPLVGPRPCWDSLDGSAMTALFGDRRTEVEEQSLRPDPEGQRLAYGQCRITGYGEVRGEERAARQVTVHVRRLDATFGTDSRTWPAEFLAANMAPLGEGLPGMASGMRAWIALPQSCTGGGDSGPAVVDAGRGHASLDLDSAYDPAERSALASAVVAVANGVMRDFDCSGAYPAPGELADPVDWTDADPRAFCGIEGFVLPDRHRKSLTTTRTVAGDGGPARVCEGTYGRGRASVRFTTVVEPLTANVFTRDLFDGGPYLRGTKGRGTLGTTRAVYEKDCRSGRVVFMVEQLKSADSRYRYTRDLLPAYVAAEAERIGCGPEKVTLPKE
ncbi:hypothetical protein [Kitasatospora albolonga]|uniref:hypothetical protein n=1 Tax=Kitasatospora albolonga TaxID=68173 RepID=UPI000D1A4DA2